MLPFLAPAQAAAAKYNRTIHALGQHVRRDRMPGGVLTPEGDFFVDGPEGLRFLYEPKARHFIQGAGHDLQTSRFEFTPVERALMARVGSDGTYCDVGAYIGLRYVLPVARRATRGRVVAFEPHPGARWHLERNLAINQLSDRVDVRPVALGKERGTRYLPLPLADMAFLDASPGPNTEPVDVWTFDAQAKDLGLTRLDVLKVDVEGGEVDFLRGARQSLQRWRPLVLLECIEDLLSRSGTSSRELVAELGSMGYACLRVVGTNDILAGRPSDLDDVARSTGPQALAPMTD